MMEGGASRRHGREKRGPPCRRCCKATAVWQESRSRCPTGSRGAAVMLGRMSRFLGAASVAIGALLCVASPASAADHRPLVAVIGENEGTETTDFVVPYGVLSASGAADVVDVAVHPGPLHMMPALTLQAKETIDSFDAEHPGGADYVIVPAVHRSDQPELLGWVREQAQRGATIVAICDGVKVVAGAGLLENREATGHWYSLPSLEKDYPRTRWVRDRRYVRDGPVVTTTGVSASLPASLALVESIAGPDRAADVARELGASGWDDAHQSSLYHLTARHVGTAARNLLAFWRYEQVGIPIAGGVDEIGLGFTADALARTYRTTAVTMARGATRVTSRRGLTILPDVDEGAAVDRIERMRDDVPPAQALDETLAEIARVDGENTARFVALQLEYPWK